MGVIQHDEEEWGLYNKLVEPIHGTRNIYSKTSPMVRATQRVGKGGGKESHTMTFTSVFTLVSLGGSLI